MFFFFCEVFVDLAVKLFGLATRFYLSGSLSACYCTLFFFFLFKRFLPQGYIVSFIGTSFSFETPPGFEANYIPEGNLVCIRKTPLVGDGDFGRK